MRAVNSILRDWVKAQMTAIETGIMSFEEVFLPHMLTHTGESVVQAIRGQRLIAFDERESND